MRDSIRPFTISKSTRVGVLMGGLSSEREVSIHTGEAVYEALIDRGYRATRIFVDRDVDLVLRQSGIQVAFLALHGRYGEDGCIQGLLEIMGIPYTGSNVMASALAMNKVKSKEIFRLHNLPTPPYYVLRGERGIRLEALREEHGAFGFPVIVKPCREGSSVGVSVARNLHELRDACEQACMFDADVMVERYVDGMEVQVAILGGRALGAIEVVSPRDIFDYRAKYAVSSSQYFYPARLSPARYDGVLTQAVKAHQAIGCSGVTRVDMVLSDQGNEYILEVNTLPGLTPTSLIPKIAHANKIDFGQLVERILGNASLKARGASWDEPPDRYYARQVMAPSAVSPGLS